MLPIKPVVMSNGVSMPPAVMSTFDMGYEQMRVIVSSGLDAGIRAFDTARKYGNESIVGKVIKECCEREELSRNDVFLTTKLYPAEPHLVKNIIHEVEVSLRNLQTDYIDLLLIHWPCPDYYLEVWKQFGEAYQAGMVRAIGIANPQVRHFEAMCDFAPDIPVHCAQFELHPFRSCCEIVEWCHNHDVAIQSYSPMCKMIPKVRENKVLQEIAQRRNQTIGQIVLRWHIQKGYVPVFATKNPLRARENMDIFNFSLSDVEVAAIDGLNDDFKLLVESLFCPGY